MLLNALLDLEGQESDMKRSEHKMSDLKTEDLKTVSVLKLPKLSETHSCSTSSTQ